VLFGVLTGIIAVILVAAAGRAVHRGTILITSHLSAPPARSQDLYWQARSKTSSLTFLRRHRRHINCDRRHRKRRATNSENLSCVVVNPIGEGVGGIQNDRRKRQNGS
jgi:hypothetical protein